MEATVSDASDGASLLTQANYYSELACQRLVSMKLSAPATLVAGAGSDDGAEPVAGRRQAPGDDVAGAIRKGFFPAGRYRSVIRHLIWSLFYPLMILLGCLALMVAFSVYVIPEFESMYSDFGIQLPHATLLVFAFARWLRTWWRTVALIVGAFTLTLFIVGYWGNDRRPGGLGRIDLLLMSKRGALAAWAWHVALLLEAGVPRADAVETAGSATGQSWLRKFTKRWAGNDRLPPANRETDLFLSQQYQLLNCALGLPVSDAKIAVFRGAATFYQDRNRSVNDWWVGWFVAFILFPVGLSMALVIVSLFAPMLSLIGGLSGGGL